MLFNQNEIYHPLYVYFDIIHVILVHVIYLTMVFFCIYFVVGINTFDGTKMFGLDGIKVIISACQNLRVLVM